MLALARARGLAAIRAGTLRLHGAEASAFAGSAEAESFALVLAIGGDDLFGQGSSVAGTLVGAARLLRPGGHILHGDLFWRREPSQAFLDALGASLSSHGRFADPV